MIPFVIPIGADGQCCTCDLAVDPCTCCSYEVGSDSYSEFHDECTDVSPPCGSDPSPSCPNATIGPIRLNSDIFKIKCLDKFVIKAYVGFNADNYGSMYGPSESIVFNNGPCEVGGSDGVITPYLEQVSSVHYRAYVYATAQNSFAGGPYSLQAYAQFYLELP